MIRKSFFLLLSASVLAGNLPYKPLFILGFATVGTTISGSLDWNVSVSNEYVWRGMSQSLSSGVTSGGLDYTTDSGYSIGTWVSNVDFGDGTSYELDGYFGYRSGPFSFGYIYYAFPNGDDLDYSEFNISAKLGAVTLGVAALVDADWEDASSFGDDPYFFLDTDFSLTGGSDLHLHIGYYDYTKYEAETDYGISLTIDDFSFGIIDTSRDDTGPFFIVSYSFSGSLSIEDKEMSGLDVSELDIKAYPEY